MKSSRERILEGSRRGCAVCRSKYDRAIQEYIKNPKVCLECGKHILLDKPSWRLSDLKKKKFCSQKCAAKYNNKHYPKRHRHEDGICECGNKKHPLAKTCHTCKVVRTREKWKSLELKKIIGRGNSRIKYSSVRTMAKEILKDSGREKRCEVCGFSLIVEVCHIKPITEFNEMDLIGEVNSLENLKYLCPNHHAMLDRGFLKF